MISVALLLACGGSDGTGTVSTPSTPATSTSGPRPEPTVAPSTTSDTSHTGDTDPTADTGLAPQVSIQVSSGSEVWHPVAARPDEIALEVATVTSPNGDCSPSTRYHLQSPGGFPQTGLSLSVYTTEGGANVQVDQLDIGVSEWQVASAAWWDGSDQWAISGGTAAAEETATGWRLTLSGGARCDAVFGRVVPDTCADLLDPLVIEVDVPVVFVNTTGTASDLPPEDGVPPCTSWADIIHAMN